MVVEGKQTSHDSTCLCQIRGNIYNSRTDPSTAPNRSLNANQCSSKCCVLCGSGDGGREVSVCLQPPGSTCPDSVQIGDAMVNTVQSKSIHKQCLPPLPSSFHCSAQGLFWVLLSCICLFLHQLEFFFALD